MKAWEPNISAGTRSPAGSGLTKGQEALSRPGVPNAHRAVVGARVGAPAARVVSDREHSGFKMHAVVGQPPIIAGHLDARADLRYGVE